MTCIVGVKSSRGVVMGGDSLASADWDCELRKDPKVGVVGDYIFGYAGSYRLGQLLLYGFDPPIPHHKSANKVYPFLVNEFIPALREQATKAGILRKNDNVDTFKSGEFAIGIYRELFYVDGNLQVGWPNQPFIALGCGAPYALGAMYVSYKYKKRGKSLLLSGLKAAENFSNGVRAPFVFRSNY